MKTTKRISRPVVAWVEDDSDFREIVQEWLLPGYDLMTYKDGGEFLEEMEDIRPDVIMLDVILPGPDGFKLCREIRKNPSFASVPILFLTASKRDQDYVKYLKAGGTAYLGKPIEKNELLPMLDELIAAKRFMGAEDRV